MNKHQLILEKQQLFFRSGKTKDVSFRIQQLQKLKDEIKKKESEILLALKQDLNKSTFESYISEISIVLEQIDYFIKNTKKLSRPKRVKTQVAHFPSVSKIYKEPYGVVLIMAPWNYPFQLALAPLVGAISSGNCAVVKTSAESPYVGGIVKEIIEDIFGMEYVAVVEGDKGVSESLLEQKFDYIFFTGSVRVGKIVMAAAAKNLTPVTLELGGKSPCIIDETANIALAAKRIAWGKFINAGQTCVAPDYVMIHASVEQEFLQQFTFYVDKFYSKEPHNNPEFPKIINRKHFDRIVNLINTNEVYYGGHTNATTNQIAPTIIINPDLNSELMQEEIFGPILPILTFTDISQAFNLVVDRPKPLALYLFTTSQQIKKHVSENISFGGGCINDTIIHLGNNNLPFGGVGESGISNYHGKYSFETFTHTKGILEKGNWLDINLRYPPYKGDLSLIKRILK